MLDDFAQIFGFPALSEPTSHFLYVILHSNIGFGTPTWTLPSLAWNAYTVVRYCVKPQAFNVIWTAFSSPTTIVLIFDNFSGCISPHFEALFAIRRREGRGYLTVGGIIYTLERKNMISFNLQSWNWFTSRSWVLVFWFDYQRMPDNCGVCMCWETAIPFVKRECKRNIINIEINTY